jgi:tRNA (guanine-N7-)-methyltransferase
MVRRWAKIAGAPLSGIDDDQLASYPALVRTTPAPIRYEEMAALPPEGSVELPALVEGSGPLELDIGFGRGRSLLERLALAPEARVIGVEVKAKWAFKVESRRVADGLTNGRAIRADVRELLPRSGPDGCLARVSVHFPDPWWKKRHGKRRVVSDALLDQLARLLAPGGELLVQTDVDDRADDYEALLAEHPAFLPAREGGLRVSENPFGARSNREVRAEEDGLPVYRLLARRA